MMKKLPRRAILTGLIAAPFVSRLAWANHTAGFASFGGVPDGLTDNTFAWGSAMAALGQGDILELDAGDYSFASKPDPIPAGAGVAGTGLWSRLVRDYTSSNRYEAFVSLDPGFHSRLENLSILAGTGTSGGIGLHAIATPSAGLTYFRGRNITVSGIGNPLGTWMTAVNIDGNSKLSSPPGARGNSIDNLLVGAAVEDWNVMLNHCLAFSGMGWHLAGNPSGGSLFVTGLPGLLSDNVNIQGQGLGDIIMGYCTGCIVSAAVARHIIFQAGAGSCKIRVGALLGGVSQGGSGNVVY